MEEDGVVKGSLFSTAISCGLMAIFALAQRDAIGSIKGLLSAALALTIVRAFPPLLTKTDESGLRVAVKPTLVAATLYVLWAVFLFMTRASKDDSTLLWIFLSFLLPAIIRIAQQPFRPRRSLLQEADDRYRREVEKQKARQPLRQGPAS